MQPDDARIVEYVLAILVPVLPELSQFPVDFIAGVERSLVVIILNIGSLQVRGRTRTQGRRGSCVGWRGRALSPSSSTVGHHAALGHQCKSSSFRLDIPS